MSTNDLHKELQKCGYKYDGTNLKTVEANENVDLQSLIENCEFNINDPMRLSPRNSPSQIGPFTPQQENEQQSSIHKKGEMEEIQNILPLILKEIQKRNKDDKEKEQSEEKIKSDQKDT